MPKNDLNVTLKGIDELLFSTEEQRQEEKREQVQQIPIDELHPFTNHPFKVVDDEAMTRTVESIAQFGVLAPLIARPRPDGDGYEIISGHRRQFAAKMAGLETLPVIVRDMDDDAATILMVDSNLQREHISPSERAFAYKMKLDALKNQGARSDLTSRQVVGKLEAADVIGKATDESGRQVQRYVRLTNLIPELLNMVDEKKISFNPAVELSYLSPEQQQEMIKAMDDTQNAPSVSQAKRIKELAQKGQFTSDAVVAIMGEEKKGELDTVTIKNDILRKYFPRSYTPRQMEEKIIQLLDEVFDAFLEEYQYQKVIGFCTDEIDGYSGFVFCTGDGKVYLPNAINRTIRSICADYNKEEESKAKEENRDPVLLPKFSCHILRHTFCTRFCENETNLKVIQEIMGHADISTTMDVYAEATQEKKKESMTSLQSALLVR